MERYLTHISQWIPPIPCNLFRLGLFLGLKQGYLAVLSHQTGSTLFDKYYMVLLAAYRQHGDDFPARLLHVMKVLDLKGLFTRRCEEYHMEDPFLRQSYSCCPPTPFISDLEGVVLCLCVQLSLLLMGEKGVECLAALTFHNSASVPELEEEVNIAVKLYKMMVMAYNRLEVMDFLGRLKQFVLDLGQGMVYKETLIHYVSVPPEFETLFELRW